VPDNQPALSVTRPKERAMAGGKENITSQDTGEIRRGDDQICRIRLCC
jgi:hypothetical protein